MLKVGQNSHTSIQYMDFVEVFSVSLDLSTIYFARFSRCLASFLSSSYSILNPITCFLGSS